MTTVQILDQVLQAAGNTQMRPWALIQLNTILREVYRRREWPFNVLNDESLSTTASQAYTEYSALVVTGFWRPTALQIRSGTSLFRVRPLQGGLSAYYANTSRLVSTGRPSKYVLDRRNSRIIWADSIPSAAETISLTYLRDVSDVALADTPALVTHTKNGEQYLIARLEMEIRGLYMHEVTEASAIATEVREKEGALLDGRFDDSDSSDADDNANARYV